MEGVETGIEGQRRRRTGGWTGRAGYCWSSLKREGGAFSMA